MTVDVRKDIVTWGNWCVAHKSLFNYQEVRPMPYSIKAPIDNDCSGTVTLCYFMAGAPDPNGQSYSGYGFTGTLLSHGQRITLAQVLPGDVVVYGPGTGLHTALFMESGTDPLTMSHGSQDEPGFVRLSVGNPEPGSPQTYLRFATNSRFPDPPKPVPAPLPSHTFPTAKDVSNANLVALKNGARARKAIANGYHLWYWASPGKWEVQVGGKPTGVTLYANREYTHKAT